MKKRFELNGIDYAGRILNHTLTQYGKSPSFNPSLNIDKPTWDLLISGSLLDEEFHVGQKVDIVVRHLKGSGEVREMATKGSWSEVVIHGAEPLVVYREEGE